MSEQEPNIASTDAPVYEVVEPVAVDLPMIHGEDYVEPPKTYPGITIVS